MPHRLSRLRMTYTSFAPGHRYHITFPSDFMESTRGQRVELKYTTQSTLLLLPLAMLLLAAYQELQKRGT
jgi:hypothetical protein